MSIPKYAALRPKTSNGSASQRWELVVYPVPGGRFPLNFRYTVAPEPLSSSNVYPLGGRQHAEMILASCLAVAEDREKGQPGPAHAKFMERLAASIHLDKHTGQPTGDTTSWISDLTDTGNSLNSLIGYHMGFGQNPKGWTTAQVEMVKEAIRQGTRRFYVPPPLPGRKTSHQWSFLYPKTSLTLVAGQSTYDLPSNFGGIDSVLSYQPGANVIYPPIHRFGERRVRRRLQSSAQAQGRPLEFGVRAKSDILTNGTAYEITFWPIPDSAYVLEFVYRVDTFNDTTVIHGGDTHFQTILEFCRAAADVMLNRKQRPHEQLAQERLIASVMHDEALKTPAKLGYNGDNSTRGISVDSQRYGYGENAVTYNGQTY
ncbi:MAG: hypothetical protein AAFV88_04385 [Planctomycetota bacterium]